MALLYRIIWIDDQYKSDISHLENKLKERIKEKNDNEVFIDIVPLDSFDRLHSKLQLKRTKPNIDLIIFDFKIEESSADLYEVLDGEGVKIPFIVFTNFPKDVNEKQLLKNEYFVSVIKKTEVDELNNLVADLANVEKCNILLLSDIHFDSTLSEVDEKEQDDLYIALNKSIQKERDPLDYIFITGDFANKKPADDFNHVEGQITPLFDLVTGEGQDRLFVVPGNHDMLWDDFKEYKIGRNPWGHYMALLERIYSNKEFLKCHKFWGNRKNNKNKDLSYGDFFWRKKIIEHKLDLIGINSTCENEPEKRGLGFFDASHANFIEKNWEEENAENYTRILLMHHNLLSPPSLYMNHDKNNVSNSGQLMKIALRHKCDLVLTGHTHSPSITHVNAYTYDIRGNVEKYKGLYNISSGTFGGYTSSLRSPCQCYMLKIVPQLINQKISKKLVIIPFLYDPDNKKWRKGELLKLTI